MPLTQTRIFRVLAGSSTNMALFSELSRALVPSQLDKRIQIGYKTNGTRPAVNPSLHALQNIEAKKEKVLDICEDNKGRK